MNNSIFAVQSLDRSLNEWENRIGDLSPVEHVGDLQFKREDKFAPLGYGNINGTKLRQCISLIAKYYFNAPQAVGVISGAVTGSPQHPMVATICKHYGLHCVNVVGTQDINKHKNLLIARNMGANFEFCKVGYAKTLESTAFKLRESRYPGYYVLETNITLDHKKHPASSIKDFHHISSRQAENIPSEIETLIVPAGSCNSVTSVLYGLTRFPNSVKRVILLGIGSYGSKDPDYIRRRLNIIGSVDNVNMEEKFNFRFQKNALSFMEGNMIDVHHVDINGSGFCTYADMMPYNYHGIEMHPRYEGKCWNYMDKHPEIFSKYMNKNTLFWIVGSEPQA